MPENRGLSDDLVFGAFIEDHTDEWFNEFDQNIDKVTGNAEKGFGKVDDALAGTEAAMGETTSSFRTGVSYIDDVLMMLEGSIGGVSVATLALSAVAVNTFAAISAAVVKTAHKMSDYASSTAAAEDAMEHLVRIHGISEDAVADAREEMHNFGLTTQESAGRVVDMIKANLDLKQSTELYARAANYAAIEGENVNDVLSGMISAVKSGNDAQLEQYDIFINSQEVLEDYAETMNTTVDALDDRQKATVVLNAVLEDADRNLNAYQATELGVQRQSELMTKQLHEMKVAIGDAFQDSHAEILSRINDQLAELLGWIVDNADELEDFGTVTVNIILNILERIGELAERLIWVMGIPKRLSEGTSEALLEAFGFPEEEIEARTENMGKHFKQLIALILGAVRTGVDFLLDLFDHGVATVQMLGKALREALRGDMQAVQESIRDYTEAYSDMFSGGNLGDYFKETYAENVAELGEMLNILDDVADATPQVEQGFYDVGKSAEDMKRSIEEAAEQFQALHDQYMDEVVQAQIDATRKRIEQQLRTSHRIEDITRNFNERMSEALEGANADRREALESHNDKRIDIIRDYQRRVADIREEFNREAHELARRRDAVGLMELIRRNEAVLDEEEETMNERIADQDRLFEQELQHIEQRKQEEIRAIKERRQEEIESLKRSLSRQREIEELHRQWQIEDRRESYEQRLKDLIAYYVEEEGLTYEHLQNMINQWGKYFTSMEGAMADYYATGNRGGQVPTSHPKFGPYDLLGGGNVIGQAGLVSGMLSRQRSDFDIPKDAGVKIQRIPEVAGRRGGNGGDGVRHLIVEVKGDALDPIIQRELVNSLLEIERNRA